MKGEDKKKATCDDVECPYHGKLKVRGKTFEGEVVSSKSMKSATVMWKRRMLIPKYERYELRSTKINVHNPPCINAKEGDQVRIRECRPLSKTKKFVIIEKVS